MKIEINTTTNNKTSESIYRIQQFVLSDRGNMPSMIYKHESGITLILKTELFGSHVDVSFIAIDRHFNVFNSGVYIMNESFDMDKIISMIFSKYESDDSSEKDDMDSVWTLLTESQYIHILRNESEKIRGMEELPDEITE